MALRGNAWYLCRNYQSDTGGGPSALAETEAGLADVSLGLSLGGPHQTQMSPLHRWRNRDPNGQPPAQVAQLVRHRFGTGT